MRGLSLRQRADLALVLLAFLWGTSFAVVKDALADASPVLFMAIRFSGAALLLVPVCGLRRVTRAESWPPEGRRWILATGAVLALGYILQTTGLKLTTAGKSAFLTGLYIALLPLLSYCVYRNAPQFKEWIGLGMAVAGMALMNWDGTAWRWGLGELLTAGCAVAYAGHLLLLNQASRYLTAAVAGFGQIAVCALVLWAALLLVETPVLRPTARVAWALALTTVFATAIPFVLLAWAQQHAAPVRVGLLLLLEMPFGALAGWWMLGEKLAGAMLGGALLILLGVMVVEMKPAGLPEHPED